MEPSLFAKNFDCDFEVPGGTLSVMADIHVFGDLVELQNLSVYADNVDRLNAGTRAMRSIYRQIEEMARAAGFRRLRITGERLTGASPGREVLLNRRL